VKEEGKKYSEQIAKQKGREGGRVGRTYPCGSTPSTQLLNGDGISHGVHPGPSKLLGHRHTHQTHIPNGLDLGGGRDGGRGERGRETYHILDPQVKYRRHMP